MGKALANLKNKDFLCLWLAQVISQFGDRINQMALIGLVAGRSPGSVLELAKILSFTIIPVFIVGPIAGVYVDRWDRRKTLFVCDFIRGLLVLSIPVVLLNQNSMIPIYGIVFLAFCLSRFYVPAKMSIIPDLVEKEDLLMANSLVSTTGMIAFVFGCAFGGLLVEKIGVVGGFICDAVTFFISGILVFSISGRLKLRLDRKELIDAGREMITAIKKSVFEEIREGASYLLSHRDIRFIISMLFILFAAAGAIYIVIIVFVQEVFQSTTKHLGFLAVFLGLGLFVGSLVYGRWGRRVSAFKAIFACLILGGIMMIVFASAMHQYPDLFLGSALSFLLGLVVGPIVIAANTVIHEVASEKMRGKVFSFLEIVMHLGFLLAMLASSFLAEHIEKFWILMAVGGLFSFVGLGGLLTYKELRGGKGMAS